MPMMIKIKYTCKNDCKEPFYINYEDLNDLLSQIQQSGWPICDECADDLDFNVIK